MGLPPLKKPEPASEDPPAAASEPPSSTITTNSSASTPPVLPPLPPLPPSFTDDPPSDAEPPPLSVPEAARLPIPEDPEHDPRAPGFSVENALADAMTQREKDLVLQELVQEERLRSPAIAQTVDEPEPEEDEDAKLTTSQPKAEVEKEESEGMEREGSQDPLADNKILLKRLDVFVGWDETTGRLDRPAKVFWLQVRPPKGPGRGQMLMVFAARVSDACVGSA